jgi:hypothetical protein
MAKLVKIEDLLRHSSGRFFSDAQLEPDPALLAEGWERRFTADEQRTKEALELYAQLGFEVRAEPVRDEELDEDCQDCRSVVSVHFRTIYTRKRKS